MSPEMSDDEKARELLIKFGVKPDELEQILVAAKTSKGKLPKLTDDEIQQIANEITSKMKESFEPSFPNNEEGKTFGKHLTDEIKDVVKIMIAHGLFELLQHLNSWVSTFTMADQSDTALAKSIKRKSEIFEKTHLRMSEEAQSLLAVNGSPTLKSLRAGMWKYFETRALGDPVINKGISSYQKAPIKDPKIRKVFELTREFRPATSNSFLDFALFLMEKEYLHDQNQKILPVSNE